MKVKLTFICIGQNVKTGPKTMNFRFRKIPGPVRVISSDKKSYFCIAESSGAQKKYHFIWWSAMGGLYSPPPPSKNTILGRSRVPRPCTSRIPEKSAVFSPSGWPSGGKTRIFFSKIGESMVWLHGTLLKNGRKKGVLFLAWFLEILGQSGSNGE